MVVVWPEPEGFLEVMRTLVDWDQVEGSVDHLPVEPGTVELVVGQRLRPDYPTVWEV